MTSFDSDNGCSVAFRNCVAHTTAVFSSRRSATECPLDPLGRRSALVDSKPWGAAKAHASPAEQFRHNPRELTVRRESGPLRRDLAARPWGRLAAPALGPATTGLFVST